MLIIKSGLLNKYPEVCFGFSTKIGLNRKSPYYFNLSHSVGDVKEVVLQNRKIFFRKLGLSEKTVATQKQIHGDGVQFIEEGTYCSESDAMITDKLNLGLAISSADCPAIFIYDTNKKIIAAVHSGWRGSQKKILLKILIKLQQEYGCDPSNLVSYIAPSISQRNYEVSEEVASLFDEKYSIKKNSIFLLDLKQINADIMFSFGLKRENVQVSSLCTYELKDLLHSFRRDGEKSGRAMGIISLRSVK